MHLKPLIYLKIHFLIILILILGNVFSNIYLAFNLPFGIEKLFAFSQEANIPTLFSSLALLLSSLLLFFINKLKSTFSKEKKYWNLLSFIFLFLGIDETAGIHEKLGSLLKFEFLDNLFIKNPWVLLYGFFVILFLIYFLNFLRILDRKFRKLIIISGFIYLVGALGFEVLIDFIISNSFVFLSNDFNIFLLLLGTLEESFEMFGIALFNYSLLKYIAKNQSEISIVLY